ncbi:MAG: FAD-dependent monooxygenase [Phycisphaerales bacterium]|nr:FAD-dependent monooxygenase [Phycisphaerales bacterium]
MSRHAVIVGNGLAGALLAVLLAKDGWRVSLYERRGDPRAKGYIGGRSINLALSARGLAGLAAAGLDRVVRERDLIPMPGRMIHTRDGSTVFQPYSHDPKDAINSVSRGGLNLTLIRAAGEQPDVTMHFDHQCIEADLEESTATFQRSDGSHVTVGADLVVGSDGAFSAIRGVMQRMDRFDYAQSYLGHGYKELHIPPRDGGAPTAASAGSTRAGRVVGPNGAPLNARLDASLFRMEPHALHIWPRGGSMMIALPNRDGSFTCTLFWPFEGEHSFAGLRTPGDIERFFAEQYADAVPHMPTLAADYMANPTSSLVTVRCWPWVRGRTVLVGDAAHAVVPFYGQGINCGFEDCVELVERLRSAPDTDAGLDAALDAYQHARKPNAEAIADMALDNFVEMRDKTGRPEFLYRKNVEQTLHAMFPDRVTPQYNLVSFSTVPYVEARQRGDDLARVIDGVVAVLPMGSRESLGEQQWADRVRFMGMARLGSLDGAQLVPHPHLGPAAALLDVSPLISPSLGVWPGDNAFSREVLLDTERGDNITLSTIRTTVHLGSHADASNHYGKASEGAVGIDRMPLGHYIGPCRVVALARPCVPGSRVTPADLPGLDEIREPRVLIRTDSFPDPDRWNADFAALSVELVDALAARGVITIGIDTPSVDLHDSKDLPAHRAILGHGIAILEGLVLRGVEAGVYELIAPPLRLEGADASPVRAILRR